MTRPKNGTKTPATPSGARRGTAKDAGRPREAAPAKGAANAAGKGAPRASRPGQRTTPATPSREGAGGSGRREGGGQRPARPARPGSAAPQTTGSREGVARARKETLERPLSAESVAGLEAPDSRMPPSTTSSLPPASPREGRAEERLGPDPAVVAQIRELEAQLDRLIDEASRHDVSSLDREDEDEEADEHDAGDQDDAETRSLRGPGAARLDGRDLVTDGIPPGARHEHADAAFDAEQTVPYARASGTSFDARPSVPPPPESVFDTARELLSTDFYLRKWGRLAMRGRSEEVDDFGFDPIYDEKLRPVLDFLYAKYFRVETSGLANVPSEGRCLLVANHSGTLPLDGVMLKTAVKREHPAGRDLRWLTEDFIYHMPFLGGAMNRLGAVRACQENAERLLANDELVAVFPEGVKGIGKLFGERYRLQRFGRGGFIKLCLRTATPIVPVAVIGAEETNPLLFRIEHLAKAIGVPYVPVTPTFPLLGPVGLLPAPTKWRIVFGEPLDLSAHGPESADDEILVGKLAERVRSAIQGMVDQAVGSRKSVFFG